MLKSPIPNRCILSYTACSSVIEGKNQSSNVSVVEGKSKPLYIYAKEDEKKEKVEFHDIYSEIFEEVITVTKNNDGTQNIKLHDNHKDGFDFKKEVHEYNRFSTDPKESLKHLKVLTRTLLELLEEMGEDKLVIFHNHRLEIKKKDYVIKGLKDFISSRDELDDEIPTDDDDSKDGKDEKEPKGLSKKELEIMKKFKV